MSDAVTPLAQHKAEHDCEALLHSSDASCKTMISHGISQVRALRSGNATAIADILRLVETAQARTAPVQRLADAVAGRFAYAVMGVSAATFAFWATLGTRIFPQVLFCCEPACPDASDEVDLLHLACFLVCQTLCCCALLVILCTV